MAHRDAKARARGRPAALCPQGSGCCPALDPAGRVARGGSWSLGRCPLCWAQLPPAARPQRPRGHTHRLMTQDHSSLWSRALSTRKAPKQRCVWAAPSASQCPLCVWDPAFLGARRWPRGLAQDPRAAAGPRGSQGGPCAPVLSTHPRPGVRAPPGAFCPQCPLPFHPARPRADSSRAQPAPWRVWGGSQLTRGPGFPTRSQPQCSGGSPVITVEETWALSQQ